MILSAVFMGLILRVFENRVLRNTFVTDREEVKEGCRR
jgi:hypothetical protein